MLIRLLFYDIIECHRQTAHFWKPESIPCDIVCITSRSNIKKAIFLHLKKMCHVPDKCIFSALLQNNCIQWPDSSTIIIYLHQYLVGRPLALIIAARRRGMLAISRLHAASDTEFHTRMRQCWMLSGASMSTNSVSQSPKEFLSDLGPENLQPNSSRAYFSHETITSLKLSRNTLRIPNDKIPITFYITFYNQPQMPESECRVLIASMPRRRAAIIKARGRPTKYWCK